MTSTDAQKDSRRGCGAAAALFLASCGWVVLARAAETPQPVVPPNPVVLQPTAALPPPAAPAEEISVVAKKRAAVKTVKSRPAKKTAPLSPRAKHKRR